MRWNISVRRVQTYCKSGRISGVCRVGRAWLIPKNARKPADPRTQKSKDVKSFYFPYGLMTAYFPTYLPLPEEAGNDAKTQFAFEIAYLRGDFDAAKHCFSQTPPQNPAFFCACAVSAAAAISENDYPLFLEINAALRNLSKRGSAAIHILSEITFALAAVSMFAPELAPAWLKNGDFSEIPPKGRIYTLYLYAKYLQTVGRFDAMLAVSQTALALHEPENKSGVFTSVKIYFRLLCAVACHNLSRESEAETWLASAAQLGLPYGFVTPFAETMPALGGKMEAFLERSYPSLAEKIVAQSECTLKNWICFHNRYTAEHVSLTLSLREYHIAVLATAGNTNVQIAQQLCCSVSTVKKQLERIFSKLSIGSRKELSAHMMVPPHFEK